MAPNETSCGTSGARAVEAIARLEQSSSSVQLLLLTLPMELISSFVFLLWCQFILVRSRICHRLFAKGPTLVLGHGLDQCQNLSVLLKSGIYIAFAKVLVVVVVVDGDAADDALLPRGSASSIGRL